MGRMGNQLDKLLAAVEDMALVKGATVKTLIRAMVRATPQPGAGMALREDAEGLNFDVISSGGAAAVCTFDALVEPTEAGWTFRLTSGGLIGGVMPVNLFDVSDVLWSEDLVSGSYWIVATVAATDGQITSVTLSAESTAPDAIAATEGAPPTVVAVPLWFVADGVATRLIGCGNVGLNPKLLYSYEKAEVACGEWPLNHVWSWEVSA